MSPLQITTILAAVAAVAAAQMFLAVGVVPVVEMLVMVQQQLAALAAPQVLPAQTGANLWQLHTDKVVEVVAEFFPALVELGDLVFRQVTQLTVAEPAEAAEEERVGLAVPEGPLTVGVQHQAILLLAAAVDGAPQEEALLLTQVVQEANAWH